jgi:hypothetical protein
MTLRGKSAQQVHIRLDLGLHEAITKEAKAHGRSTSDMIRDMLAAAMGLCPTCGGEHARSQRRRAQVAA